MPPSQPSSSGPPRPPSPTGPSAVPGPVGSPGTPATPGTALPPIMPPPPPTTPLPLTTATVARPVTRARRTGGGGRRARATASRRTRGPRRRLRRRTHPVAWLGPLAGSVFTVLLWFGVARSSGSGWVQAVGALLAAVLVVGLAAPAFAARALRATVETCPADAVAGVPFAVEVSVTGPARLTPLEPTGEPAMARGRPRGPRMATVEVVPIRRGVLASVAVDVATSVPFGMLWWSRQVRLPLPRPVHVAPRAGTLDPAVTVPDLSAGDASRRRPAAVGEPRGVRPYQAGDRRRSVHWPATAHTSSLMVREAEAPLAEPVVLEVVLDRDPEVAERQAERAMGTGQRLLAQGVPVVLVTTEAHGRCHDLVTDRFTLGRRLARAVPG